MIKYTFALFCTIFALTAVGQTVIYYEDGSVYTVQPNEKVYVEVASKLYTKKSYKNGNEFFAHKKPNEKVDYEEQLYEGMKEGSPEWCEAYAPYLYANGYTFEDQIYIRYCTEDGDGG
jgi:hypothetical protein